MKKNKITRAISLLLMVLLLTSMFAGCSKTEDTGIDKQTNVSNKKSESDNKIDKEPIVLKYWMRGPGASKPIQNMGENLVYQELEKRTGVKVEFIHPSYGQETEQFQLMIASDDLPDIIQNYGRKYPGGPDKAIKDGVFLRLNELIDEHAPNFKKVRESIPGAAKLTITDEGNVWSFPSLMDAVQEPYAGLMVRQDWLDELGLERPKTIDEFHDMLVAFKEEKNAVAPFQFRFDDWTLEEVGGIVSAFDTGVSFILKDGEVKYGPLEPGYKEFLTLMRDWYSEGLIYKDFEVLTNYDQFKQMLATDKIGAFFECYGIIDDLEPSVKQSTPDSKFSLRALPQPALNEGERIDYRQYLSCYNYNEAVITSACEYPEEAVKWFDYAYSDEGAMLFNWGVEGKTYEMVDGKPQYTDLMLNNPDGLGIYDVMAVYKVHQGPALRLMDSIKPFETSEGVKDAKKTWVDADYDMVLPYEITRTADEDKKYSAIMNEIKTYVNEMNVKFVMGIEPMDKYDDFVETLKNMRIDELVDIQQAAYERYLNR